MISQESLTPRQFDVLEFICEREGAATVREIATAFGFKSPNAVTRHLKELERKGFVRLTRKAGRIEITNPIGVLFLSPRSG